MNSTATPPNRLSAAICAARSRASVEAGVEAVDEDEHVAIDADAAGNMRGELGLEFVGIELTLVGDDDVVAALARAQHRLFDRARVMAGRDRQDVERVMRAVGRGTCAAAPCSPLRVEATKTCTGRAVVAATAGPPPSEPT